MRLLTRCLPLVFVPFAAAQAAPDEPAPVPEPPDLPAPVQSGEEMEPDITIIRKGKDTIQEYRRNGKLYMVKIQPQVGPAYYMLDTNGDGELDVKKNDLDDNTNINKWTLFEWDWP
ncbi:DUF2782 domain-containing protein [Methylomonas sp. SURF-1]|uniref:DUF2782 domain-containing protein n=1 Tax=Methylomonas aurea TaxID=2952224 RepID=A0ABT1ULZ7_9GAMM|nr:DUF2782 domain-containing protein [Methylomonas sp. SURF-1]MCQ8183264.1 DUF2782 domain-containing protein [Methylomonas sp. SURF-1]